MKFKRDESRDAPALRLSRVFGSSQLDIQRRHTWTTVGSVLIALGCLIVALVLLAATDGNAKGWLVTGKEAILGFTVGIAATIVYSETYGRVTQRSIVEYVARAVAEDTHHETRRVLQSTLSLFPTEVFETKSDTTTALEIPYAQYWNERIVESDFFKFRGKTGRIALYRLVGLAGELRQDNIMLDFLFRSPWRPGAVTTSDEITELLTSLYGIWQLARQDKVGACSVALFNGPLTYRAEITDSATMLSYFDTAPGPSGKATEDTVYYAYDKGTPTYRALRRWFYDEVQAAIATDLNVSVVGSDSFATAIKPLHSDQIAECLQTALNGADPDQLERSFERRMKELESQRELILAR